MKKKALLMIMVVMILMMCFSAGLSAATERTEPLDLIEQTTDLSSAAEKWAWDADTRTLTLSGIDFNVHITQELKSNDLWFAIALPEGSTVKVADGTINKINVTADGDICANGIYFYDTETVENCEAAFCGKGTLNITNSTVKGYGIAAYNVGDTFINDVTLNLTATNIDGEGLDASDLTVTNAKIRATGFDWGMYVDDEMTITDSKVLAGGSGIAGYGCYPDSLTVNNSLFISDGSYYSLKVYESPTLNNASILSGGKFVPLGENFYYYVSKKDTINDIRFDTEKTVIIGNKTNTQLYGDVKFDDWFYDETASATALGLMNGVSDTAFAPEAKATRGMLVTILYRMAGSPEVSGFNPFTDVKPTDWYYNAVLWASETSLTEGMTPSTFVPDGALTREQICTFLYRYADHYLETVDTEKYTDGYTMDGRDDLSKFSDKDNVQSWAKEKVQWCVANGLMSGMTDTTIVPQGTGTRAQLAAFLSRFCHFVNNWEWD